ncbi:MAG: type IX secretion system outer membrane channel protein PorV [Bacteroidales bacterium]|nr:type IX secretion system outer membrane channel protein PorV [Bacteroidales bacterium]
MSFWLKNITVVFFLILASGKLLAQIPGHNADDRLRYTGGSISTAVPFLLISPDARAGALGDAGVASSPDINSQHWNAAKYAFIDDQFGVSLTFSPWLRTLVPDMNLLYLAGYYRIDNDWVLGSSIRYFSLGKVVFRIDQDDPGTTYSPNEYAIDLSLSRKLSPNFSLAVAGRYIRSDLTMGYQGLGASKSSAANSGAVDISMFYTREISTSNTEASSFALGMNISNVGAKISYSQNMEKDFLPANLRLGGSYTVQVDQYNEFTGMIDFNKLLVPTPPVRRGDTIIAGMDDNVGVIQGIFQSFHDAPGGWREEFHEVNISVGVEYVYNKTFAFRGGYFHESGHRDFGKGGRQFFTLGAGLRFNVFEVDFSYLMPRQSNPNNPLKNTLRFTLKFNFAEYMRRQNTQLNTN